MKRILILLALLLLPLGLVAQTKEVSGEVISADDNQPIAGATVVAKGTTAGMATNAQGKFQFSIPSSATTLVVSCLGMQSREVVAGTKLRIVLRSESKQLEEVVTVGYSKATKRSFTGSATTVKADALERKNISNISQALAGEVPGVTIVNSSGQPGSGAAVYVRGVGSVNAGTAPLYVVDGVPYSGSISAINPSDIESTTLLKDAASTAIYGARGSNGVIVITTKSGKTGNFRVGADIKYGVNTMWIPRYEVISNPDEYLEIGWEALRNYRLNSRKAKTDEEARQWATKNLFGRESVNQNYNYYKDATDAIIDPTTGKLRSGLTRRYTPESWIDEALRTSTRTEANVQLSGGTNKLRGFFSLGYLMDNGVAKNTDFKRLSTRMNLDFNPYPWLSTNARLGYTRSESNDGGQSSASSGNVFYYTDGMPPIYPVYTRNEEGEKTLSPYYPGVYEYDFGPSRGFSGNTNPLAKVVYNLDDDVTNKLVYNLGFTIRFLRGFTFENTLGGSYSSSLGRSRSNKWYGDNVAMGGSISHGLTNTDSYNLLSLLRYSKKLGLHSIETFIAHEANNWNSTYDYASKKGLVDPFGTDLSNGISTYGSPNGSTGVVRLESYFAQANYDYAGRYFVSGTFRRDGSSKFLNDKWGNFGSVGLAWVASEEKFFDKIKNTIPYLKVKTSYGTLGQQSGLSSDYVGRRRYSVENTNDKVALILSGVDDPYLSWEHSSMFQIGAEFNVGRLLSANIEFYNKRSSSLIYDRRVAPSRGYAIKKVNDGVLENRGVDIDLTAHLVRRSDFRLDLRLNAGFLSNRMVTMPLDPTTGEQKFLDSSSGQYGRQKNRSLYDYYIREYAGVNHDTGESLWTLYYKDVDNDGVYDKTKGDEPISSYAEYVHAHPDATIAKTTTTKRSEATRSFVGKSALPTVRGGISLSLSYRGVELDVLCSYGLGGYGYDYSYASLMDNKIVGAYNWHTDIRNRWTPENKDSNIPRLNNGYDTEVAGTSTRFLISNNFLHLSNVRIGYNLPKHWISPLYLQGLRVWISGDNLALLSARKGFNPSLSLVGASSNLRYNPVTTITAGLSLNF